MTDLDRLIEMHYAESARNEDEPSPEFSALMRSLSPGEYRLYLRITGS